MRKRFLATATVVVLIFGLVGCSYTKEEMMSVKSNDTSTWIYEGDKNFVAIGHTFIKDGDIGGMDIIEFVDLDTGNMYIYTSKYASGFGCTMIPKYADSEGTIQVYEDLEALRELHNYEVKE